MLERVDAMAAHFIDQLELEHTADPVREQMMTYRRARLMDAVSRLVPP
jgi:hypothetical protein